MLTPELALIVGANIVVAVCYFLIMTLVGLSLWRSRQEGVNALGVATLGIFLTCGLHHAVHAEHILASPAAFATLVDWHTVVVDIITVAPAIAFLSLRRRYGLLAQGEGVILGYEREIRRQRRERIAITDAMLDALFTIDPQGRVVGVNRYALDLLGCPLGDVLGRPFSALFVDPGRAELGLRQALAGDLRDYEATLAGSPGADGLLTPIAVSLNGRTVRDPEGQVQVTIIVARDVRQQKAMESELRAYSEHLEDLVDQRTVELRKANQELDAFAYSISHDLRAPLRAISGFSEAVIEDYGDRLDDEGRGYLERVRAGVRRMAALIDDLLDFSRLGRRELAVRAVDLGAVAREVLGDFQQEIAQRGVRVEVRRLPTVVCDAGVIGQVFQNLVSNALKYTRHAEAPTITIGADDPDPDRPDCVRLWVRDNGIGFDMLYHDRIWQVFQRLHTADEYESTGIGLALVRRIVERHGGEAWAKSEGPNQGATFYVRLPRSRAAASPLADLQPTVAPGPTEMPTAPLKPVQPHAHADIRARVEVPAK